MRLLECNGLTMRYENQTAVRDVSFTVEEGDFLCIVGENGSGKTTLIKGLLGLMAPDAGMIRYAGVRPGEIGYLPQQSAVQRDFPASVFEVAVSGCLNRRGLRPFYSAKDKLRARDALARLGAGGYAGKSYRELSGGQQQRVLLARALCAADRLLLLDEPVASLDPMATAEFYAVIAELNQKNGMTVIMVSHDVISSVKYAGKILHMDTKSVYFGPTADYLATDIGKKMTGAEHDA